MRSLETRVVYLIGSSRSGTTWLQRMLGAHPEVASPQETDLFSRYIVSMLSTWQSQLPDDESVWRSRRYKGLPGIITREQFLSSLQDWVGEIYRSVLSNKASAEVLLEKNPEYSLYIDDILQLVPNASFIHLIRDGRDVSASLTRVASAWGDWWAPRETANAARRWRQYVEASRRASSAPGGYLEVRYEALAGSSGACTLNNVFTFCGVKAGEDNCYRLLQRYRPGAPMNTTGGIVWGGEVLRRLGGEPAEPEGFVGDGSPGSWRTRFGAADRRVFDRVAGDLLLELGYEPNHEWVEGGGISGAYTAARALLSEHLTHQKALARRRRQFGRHAVRPSQRGERGQR